MDTRILLGGCLGGGGGSLTGTFIQPSPLGDLKKNALWSWSSYSKNILTQKYKTFLVTQLQHYLSFLMQKWSSIEARTWRRQIWIRGPFLECPGSYWARKAIAVRIQDGSLNSFADNVMKLSFKKTNGPVCRQGLMPSLVRFWLKRLISKQANGPLQHCFVIFLS